MSTPVALMAAQPAEDQKSLPSYMRPLPLLTQLWRFLILFFISTFLLAGGLLVANARMPDPAKVRPLPDILFEVIPKVGAFESLTNVCIFLLNAMVVYVVSRMVLLERRERGCADLKVPFDVPYLTTFCNRVLFTVFDSGLRPYRLQSAYVVVAIRFLTVYSCMMVYRVFCITMTSYPATDNACQNPVKIEHPFRNMILTVVTLGSGAIHCGDLMFSGHTIILSLATCVLWDYGVYVHRWFFRVVGPLLLFAAFYFIIASRSHYTDDIVVSAYSTVTTFMLLRHRPTGALWQLQVLIRWWPCPGSSAPVESEEQHAGPSTEVVIETVSTDANAHTLEEQN
ncbi:shingomyelin synthase [Strigomonas culicis]|uniref:Shingomyelin synthase n=1 Tax=Strigomonas culicis TaxID=28005 RepID=S9UR71_9TRYP|nr:shingomyelin synthase [Strigomonas culicis]EPY35838.1 shingomyelin synthase [Strigomonas culicis]|eukprot:EPY31393.1 shingomyelin synthase [Strigomonas culicis]